MNFSELKNAIESAPSTFIPALLRGVVDAARAKNMFKDEEAMIRFISANHSISKERWEKLMASNEALTPDEIKAGWHFCVEFDGLLIGPGMVEMSVCTCLNRRQR